MRLGAIVAALAPQPLRVDAAPPAPAPPPVVRRLTSGATVRAALSSAQVHRYEVALSRGDYLQLIVEQQGTDVALRVLDPRGELAAAVDAVDDLFEPETLALIAEDAGTYRIEIRRSASAPLRGRYAIRVDEMRPALSQDKDRVDAERAFQQGHELSSGRRPAGWLDALARFDAAAVGFQALGDRRGSMRVLLETGNLQWRLGRDAAVETGRRAEQIARELGDSAAQSAALRIVTSACQRTGDSACSLEAIDEAIAIDHAAGHARAEAEDLNEAGIGYGRTGSAEEAIAHFQRALPLARATQSAAVEANILNNLGIAYKDLGEYDVSLKWYEQALVTRRAAGDPEYQGVVLNNMGNLQRLLGRNEKALGLHTRALALARKSGGKENEARSLNTIGLTYYALGQYAKALDFHEQALTMRVAIADWAGQAVTLEGIGNAWRRLGEPDKAVDALTRALTLRRRIREQYGEPNTLRDLANAERDRDHVDAAINDMRAAVNLDEGLRARITSPDLRTTFVAAAADKYEILIDMLERRAQQAASTTGAAATDDESEALAVSERARARVLLESLIDARVDLREGIEPALLARERSLQRQLNDASGQLSRVLATATSSESAAAAAQHVERLSDDYRRLQTEIRRQSPRYAAVTQPQPLTARDIQAILGDDTVLLEFSLGEDRSWLWAVTAGTLTSVELPSRRRIETAARSLYASLTARQKRQTEPRADYAVRVTAADTRLAAEARAMSRMLFGRFAAPLRNEWRGKRLAIVAGGALEYLPFAVLPEPAAQTHGAAASRRFLSSLVDGHEIVSIPSASVLSALRKQTGDRPATAETVAILADPVFEATDPRVLRDRAADRGAAASPADPRARFSRLPFSREEADAIADIAGHRGVFEATDFQASRATALGGALRNHRIIHFATHGVVDTRRPALTGLVLSQLDERGVPQNGYVRLTDIYNMRLDADLVVLSACQTALGKQIAGEGVVGIARAFMYAGAPRVVATLWEVNDAATSELMKLFYRGVLLENRTPAAALRAAQLEMSRNPRWASPYYWAGFVVQGDWN
jgi:CHAT domain-containing protein/Tfp pilus assembly protein PilF